MSDGEKRPRRRNKGFEETHAALIECAIRLVADKGVEALSLSELARETGVNRTTIYYHFKDRDDLVAAIREWSADRIGQAFQPGASIADRTRYVTRLVLENPEALGLWTEDFLSPGDIRSRYPDWDDLVAGLGAQLRDRPDTADVDPEVYSVILLTVALVAPRVYRNSVCPDLDMNAAIERFTAEQLRMLSRDGIGGASQDDF